MREQKLAAITGMFLLCVYAQGGPEVTELYLRMLKSVPGWGVQLAVERLMRKWESHNPPLPGHILREWGLILRDLRKLEQQRARYLEAQDAMTPAEAREKLIELRSMPVPMGAIQRIAHETFLAALEVAAKREVPRLESG